MVIFYTAKALSECPVQRQPQHATRLVCLRKCFSSYFFAQQPCAPPLTKKPKNWTLQAADHADPAPGYTNMTSPPGGWAGCRRAGCCRPGRPPCGQSHSPRPSPCQQPPAGWAAQRCPRGRSAPVPPHSTMLKQQSYMEDFITRISLIHVLRHYMSNNMLLSGHFTTCMTE